METMDRTETTDRNTDIERIEALRRELEALCSESGPIPFARFMELCLYHPRYGYYTAGRPPMGSDGDFTTYPNVHPAFGRLIARQATEFWEVLGKPSPFTIVETGSADGTLALDLLTFIENDRPDLYSSMIFVSVEKSPKLREHCRLRLKGFDRVTLIDPERFFSETGAVTGCFISNELIDAFPVHLVEMRNGELEEIYVRVDSNGIREEPGPLSDPRLSTYLEESGAVLAEGRRTEISLQAVEWITDIGARLKKGFMLTLDYGYSSPEYFHPLRIKGTLMSFLDHRASADYGRLPGGRDLTAHVNFTALIRAGENAGIRYTGLIPQDRFLVRLGLLDEMEAVEQKKDSLSAASYWREKLALRSLIAPQPRQGGFQALIQHKGVSSPALCAFIVK